MTKEQAKIEANFSLFMGYLKLDSEKTDRSKNAERRRVFRSGNRRVHRDQV